LARQVRVLYALVSQWLQYVIDKFFLKGLDMAQSNRPLSPHLQIYKPQLTSMLSIVHRATGAALCAGAVLITVGLLALADGFESWHQFRALCAGWCGKLVIAAFALALVYHWLNGLRHLAWDAGYGLDIKQTYASGKILVLLFVILSAALLYFGLRSGS
jgi:succinate dehydrogenase / fumarate reductase, cytochrome b subunit